MAEDPNTDTIENELKSLESSFDVSIKRKLLLWVVRWIIGFAIIAVVTSYFPGVSWLWYVGIAIAIISLIAIFAAKSILSRRFRIARSTIESLQREIGVPGDEELASLITGEWKLDTTHEGADVSALSEYRSDGAFVSSGSSSNGGFVAKFKTEGTWRVQDNYLIWTVEKSSNPGLIAPGTTCKEEILSISGQEMTYRDQDGTVWTELKAEDS